MKRIFILFVLLAVFPIVYASIDSGTDYTKIETVGECGGMVTNELADRSSYTSINKTYFACENSSCDNDGYIYKIRLWANNSGTVKFKVANYWATNTSICTGTATGCSSLGHTQCNQQLGCFWTSFPTPHCQGTPTPCSSFSPALCTNQIGCSISTTTTNHWEATNQTNFYNITQGYNTINLDTRLPVAQNQCLAIYSPDVVFAKNGYSASLVFARDGDVDNYSTTSFLIGEYAPTVRAFITASGDYNSYVEITNQWIDINDGTNYRSYLGFFPLLFGNNNKGGPTPQKPVRSPANISSFLYEVYVHLPSETRKYTNGDTGIIRKISGNPTSEKFAVMPLEFDKVTVSEHIQKQIVYSELFFKIPKNYTDNVYSVKLWQLVDSRWKEMDWTLIAEDDSYWYITSEYNFPYLNIFTATTQKDLNINMIILILSIIIGFVLVVGTLKRRRVF